MEKVFSLQLNQHQVEFLNSMMQNGHSLQVFEKYERRKKAQKKLDDMYVAQFSLRPVKKVKKDNQHHNHSHPQSNVHSSNKQHVKQTDRHQYTNRQIEKVQKPSNNKQQKPLSTRVQRQKPQLIKQDEEQQYRSSRSQRVSKPTQAYMQFQEQTFKRKFVQNKQKQQPKHAHNNYQLTQSTNKVSTNNSQSISKAPQSQLMRNDGLIELKSIIAEKMEKKHNNNKTQPSSLSLVSTAKPNNNNEHSTIITDNSKKIQQQKQESHIPQKYHHQSIQFTQSSHNKNTQTISTKPPYPIQQKQKSPPQHIHNFNSPKNNNNLLLTVLQQNFQELQQMPQTRQSAQSQSNYNKQIKQKHIVNPKEIIQNEKLRSNNKTNISHHNIDNLSHKNRISPLSYNKVTYNLSTKQPSLTKAWRILQRLKLHKSSWPFRYPVNPISQGVPDYLQKIKHPMDLKTIQKKLKGQKYGSQQQFYSDIELMLSNSYRYNPKQSKYYQLTNELQSVFNQLKSKTSMRNYNISSNKKTNQQINNQDQQQQQQQAYKSDQQIDNDDVDENQQQQLQQIKDKSNQNNNNNNNNNDEQKNILQKSADKKKKTITNNKRQRQQNMQQNKINIDNKYQQPSKVIVTNQNQPNKRIQKSNKKSQHKHIIINDYPQLQQQQNYMQNKIKENKQQISNNSNSNNGTNRQKVRRIGYNIEQECRVPLIKREHLLYDILHLQLQQSKSQLFQFILNNSLLCKQLILKNNNSKMVGGENQHNQHQQQLKQQQQQQQQQQQRQLQLDRLDIQGYKLLRQHINKLISQQQQLRQHINKLISQQQQLVLNNQQQIKKQQQQNNKQQQQQVQIQLEQYKVGINTPTINN